MRRSRYRGLTRTHVQHVLTAIACNLSRLADWHDTTPSGRRAPHFRTPCNTAGLARPWGTAVQRLTLSR
ncbi:hypothetical protein ACWD4T_29265 [Streptomyces umbrinus]